MMFSLINFTHKKARFELLLACSRWIVCLFVESWEWEEVRGEVHLFSSIKELKCFQNIKKSSLNISSN